MFASRITKEVRIGKDTVTIRALSGRAKERAQQATMTRAASMLAQVGGAAVMAEIEARRRGCGAECPIRTRSRVGV